MTVLLNAFIGCILQGVVEVKITSLFTTLFQFSLSIKFFTAAHKIEVSTEQKWVFLTLWCFQTAGCF